MSESYSIPIQLQKQEISVNKDNFQQRNSNTQAYHVVTVNDPFEKMHNLVESETKSIMGIIKTKDNLTFNKGSINLNEAISSFDQKKNEQKQKLQNFCLKQGDKTQEKKERATKEEKLIQANANKKCKLCNVNQEKQPHLTKQCKYSGDFYHLTDLPNVKEYLKQGLKPEKRQLGRAVYISDNPRTMLKYALRHRQQFSVPVLLKLKVNATRIQEIKSPQQMKKLDKHELSTKGIQCIKYPYSNHQGASLFMWAMYRCDYSIIGITTNFSMPDSEDSDNVNGKPKMLDWEIAHMTDEILSTPCGVSDNQRRIEEL